MSKLLITYFFVNKMIIDKWIIIPRIHNPKAIVWDNGKNNVLIYVLKSISAIENVPNVLNAIRLFSSLWKVKKTKNIMTDPIVRNISLKSANIFPNDKIAKIKPVIAKGRFFMMFIILV